MVLLAVLDGRLEVRDPLCGMGIGLGLLCRLGVSKRGFGVRHEHIRMSLFAVINGFLRMADGFGQVILGLYVSLSLCSFALPLLYICSFT